MKKQLFDQGWEFHEASGFIPMLLGVPGQPVNLPHDIMITKPRAASNPSGSHGGYFPGGIVTYRKKFHAREDWQGQSVQLEFEGVYMNAEVSVNNQLLHIQPYGYSSFVLDITPYLIYGEENSVQVIANNSAQVNSRWYSGTGIYRHVWLRIGGRIHIQPWGVFVTTPVIDPDVSVVQVETELASLSGNLEKAVLRTTVLDADGKAIAQVGTPVKNLNVQQSLLVRDAQLWSVDNPNLYTLLSEVLLNSEVVDREQTIFGIRSIEVDSQNGFRLNGEPLKLKGGCIHHDHGPLGAASYDRAEERKVELLKSAGFNALRTAHNPPAPALLDACDRLGMLVIDETFDCWRISKSPNDYHLYFEDWWQRDTEALIKRDRNHPSIIIWSIGNEILESLGAPDGPALCQMQADFVRSLDSTRFVNSAVPFNFFEFLESGLDSLFDPAPVPQDPEQDQWDLLTKEFNQHLDIVGYNYLLNRYAVDRDRHPTRVIAGTETFPHQAYAYWKETERLPNVIGDFVWTAFDYIGESGIGAVQFDGQVQFSAQYPYHLATCGDFDICGFKRPQSYFRDLLWGVRRKPFIAVLDPALYGKPQSFTPWGWEPVIDSWTFPDQEDKPTQVDVYAVDDEVELFINGTSAGRKAVHQNKASFEVNYQPGTIEAVGFTAGEQTGRTQLTTASAPTALRLSADRTALKAQYGDLAYVTIEVVDKAGVIVKHGEPEISVEVSGVGELIALGAANPYSEESYVADHRRAYQGKLLAIICTTGESGKISLQAKSEGMATDQINLEVN